jgi:hypothetical protein
VISEEVLIAPTWFAWPSRSWTALAVLTPLRKRVQAAIFAQIEEELRNLYVLGLTWT